MKHCRRGSSSTFRGRYAPMWANSAFTSSGTRSAAKSVALYAALRGGIPIRPGLGTPLPAAPPGEDGDPSPAGPPAAEALLPAPAPPAAAADADEAPSLLPPNRASLSLFFSADADAELAGVTACGRAAGGIAGPSGPSESDGYSPLRPRLPAATADAGGGDPPRAPPADPELLLEPFTLPAPPLPAPPRAAPAPPAGETALAWLPDIACVSTLSSMPSSLSSYASS